MNNFYPLRVSSRTNETRDAVVITFDIPEEQRETFRYTAGQHLTFRAEVAGGEVRRSYSICSAPFENRVSVAIKLAANGLFSTWANRELLPGHTIECMAPAGHFGVSLEPESKRHHVAFAAGSGITPILSILKSTLEEEPRSRFTLIYGNRASSSVIFREDLEDLKNRYLERFNLVFILSREQQDIELFNGRIDGAKCDQILRRWIDPRDIDVAYICGPQSMMAEVSASLQANGVSKEHIRMELFGTEARVGYKHPLPVARADRVCHVTVIQDGRRREFSVQNDGQTLLDGALEQGIELPYSCKGGVCSTCRCKMTQGKVDMDVSFALEDYEIARGFVLTCQSYPLSSEIVLDFDQDT
ncbi:MAG: phenylacetate-CoA oxygenase/reductase subunit PaaK [Acidobacteriota bacterium]|nr:phenylacetate-CoA oxygenase/reductase subunit PaaK [Acidobacteriota bacterium]